ncbi:MAG: hypothetical protein J6R81_03000 [Alistipes sp.]|nr:hypothetical protein [Alistipes sp.]
MRRLFLLLLLILLVGCFIAVRTIIYLHDEKQRLELNQQTLLSDVELYRTAAGESAASVGVLTLEIDELREARSRDAEQIRDLGIRLRRAESYARSVTQSEYVARTTLRDSIIVRDTIRDTVRVFLSGDTWSRVEGVIRGDSIGVEVHSIDTLFQVVYRVPRRFLFFRYGTKGIHQEIVSSNPHTQLVYSEYVELKR